MRKIFLIAFISLPLVAGFFPKTVQTHVADVEGTTLKLATPFPVTGMSGVVIHKYGEQIEAVTGYIEQTSADGKGEVIEKEVVHHDKLPTIKTPVGKGDKVIGGYLYNTVLLLAPDAETYTHIVDTYPNKKWIHPDLLATFLSTEGDGFPTRQNLEKFAKAYQVGLVYIVKRDAAVLLDPISGKIVGKRTVKTAPKKAQYPFFMRFDSIKTGLFSDSGNGDYYKTMEQF